MAFAAPSAVSYGFLGAPARVALLPPHIARHARTTAMPTQPNTDANFFSLVHHVIQAAHGGSDRRGNDRRTYRCEQWIAPYSGEVPTTAEFRCVQCHDLSPGGFSYLADGPPESDNLVVALGKHPYLFVVAQILHSDWQTVDGREVAVVGCRFVEKIEKHRYRVPAV